MESQLNTIDGVFKSKIEDTPCCKSKYESSGSRCDDTLRDFEYLKNIPKSELSQISYLLSNGEKYTKKYYAKYIEVSFKGNHKSIFDNANNLELRYDDFVVVEREGGFDLGRVTEFLHSKSQFKNEYSDAEAVLPELIRRAVKDDLRYFNKKIEDERNVVLKSKELVATYKLEMKITEAYWQYDRQRLTVYFTSPQRIDFRELAKGMARLFKTRIELRQISSREETRRLGSFIGTCGRELCCTSFLNTFNHVTIEHAKAQHLSHNISKLSGNCGRLKCCIRFEYDCYAEAACKFPPLHSIVETENGIAKIAKIDIFGEIITLYLTESGVYKKISPDELSIYVKSGKVHPPEPVYSPTPDEEELRFLEG